ncbi:MAG: DUF5704 domain-containing protein [Lachnospiraceae bacterium]|nr:DUF5704 domain-containing protein [Lachnospiraceae bacterium]
MEIKKRRSLMKSITALCILMLIINLIPAHHSAGGTAIDENTVIRTDQLGSVAGHAGDYGWDSRGAYFTYSDASGKIKGQLGRILFCDENGIPRDRMWAAWGNEFPDWWGRMLAEMVRQNTPSDKMKDLRRAFSDSVTFECTWVIAIGVKDNSVGSGPVLTLREDNTLRMAYNVDISKLDPAEKLYSGDQMTDSLSDLLPGEKWGKTSQKTFEERNPYIYRVAVDSYAIRIFATDCTECARAGKEQGDYCVHNNRELLMSAVPIEYNGNRYTRDASFVWEGQTANYREPVFDGYRRVPAKDDMSSFYGRLNNGKIVVEKDSVLYLVYESTTGTETVTATPGPDPVTTPPPAGDNPPAVSPGATPAVTPTGGPTIPGPTTPGPVTGTPYATPVPTYAPVPQYDQQQDRDDMVLDTMDTMAKAVICSDVFDVRTAVPSTESVYIKASARNLMYRINARTVSGKVPLSVTVGVPYTLVWKDEEGNEHEESGTAETVTVIYRDYSFIHLDSLEFYLLDNMLISNPAMYPSQTELKPSDAGAVMPDVSQPVVYGSASPVFKGNIDYPEGFSSYILSSNSIFIDGENTKPAIPVISAEEAYWTVQNSVGELMCRNDEFTVDNNDVLGTSGWHEYGSGSQSINMVWPQIVEFDTSEMFGDNYFTIPVQIRNGLYRTNTRLVKYRLAASFGTPGAPYDALIEVNPVNVHTPVYSEAFIEECDPSDANISYFQETRGKPEGSFVIVNGSSNSLGSAGSEHDTEDFLIRFNNTGNHPVYSGRLGSSFDYSSNVNGLNGGSYIEGNYLRFPFDVVMDVGNDRSQLNDRTVKKGTWVKCENLQRFYPAGPVAEGFYDIEAETVAVNAYGVNDRGEDIPQKYNGDPGEYLVGNRIRVYISGKIYGLSLIDISSKAEWNNVFSKDSLNKYIKYIPGAIPGPNWPANDGTLISLSPSGRYSENELKEKVFYYTPGTGNELGRETGRHKRYTFPLMAGSHPDAARSNRGVLKSGYRWRFRIKTSGYTMDLPGSRVVIKPSYRIISGTDTGCEAVMYVPDGNGDLMKTPEFIEAKKVLTDTSGIQVWDFEFLIPDGFRMAAGGKPFTVFGKYYPDIDVFPADGQLTAYGSGIWVENGSAVVNFEIKAIAADGSELYSYNTVNGSCNMWKTEGQETDKTDFYGQKYRFSYGDIAIVSIEKGASSDYVIDHQN